MTQPNRNHVLYRFYNNADELLYVGITVNLTQRIEKHRGEKDWWPEVSRVGIEHFPDRQTVLAAERAAIENEKPRHNTHLNKGSSPAPRALAAEEDIDGIVGRHFHSWRELREGEDTRGLTVKRDLTLEWQGHVIDRIETGLYLIEIYSWWDGCPAGQRLIPVASMTNWTFYDDAVEMQVALGCREFEHEPCGADIAFVVRSGLGPIFACSYHADHYSGKRQEIIWVHGKPKLP